MKKEILIFFSLLLIFYSCALQNEPPEPFISELENIKATWAPDKRTSVFDIEYTYEDGKWKITGETTSAEAQKAVTGLVQETFLEDYFSLDLQILPPVEFGDTTHALVTVSAGNLRSTPSHRAELVDQVLMGMVVKLIKARSYWYLVQTPSDYLGWITRGSLERLDNEGLKNWQSSEKVTLRSNYEQIYSKPSEKSQVVADLVLGTVFLKKSKHAKWLEIELPDGRTGFVKGDHIEAYREVNNSIYPDREKIVTRAKTMMGIPYMWGGNSTKALDCSGFTSTVFRSEGYQLPRDASMQVELGEEIIPDSNYVNILPGDLIFFGSTKSITHVGICLGGSHFIHASGDVHINSLDENEELYNSYRKNTFRHIKRIIKN